MAMFNSYATNYQRVTHQVLKPILLRYHSGYGNRPPIGDLDGGCATSQGGLQSSPCWFQYWNGPWLGWFWGYSCFQETSIYVYIYIYYTINIYIHVYIITIITIVTIIVIKIITTIKLTHHKWWASCGPYHENPSETRSRPWQIPLLALSPGHIWALPDNFWGTWPLLQRCRPGNKRIDAWWKFSETGWAGYI